MSRGISLAVAESAADGGVAAGVSVSLRLASTCLQGAFVFPRMILLRRGRCGTAMERWRRLPPVSKYTNSVAIRQVHSSCLCRGGSWGQGAPWQYALLARRLLEEGGASRVAICKHSLFPHGDVDTMVEDIANGLEWCREQQRAQPKLRVVLAAQSAGAHLCSLYLSRRTAAEAEAWQPDKFVALSGVFDIAKHFAHERTRLVHWLSPMWLAMVGKKTAAGEAVNQQLAIVSSDPADSRGLDADELAAAGLACRDLAAVSRGTVQSSPIEDWTEQEMKAWTVASPTRMLNLGRVAAGRSTRDRSRRVSW